jgi:hypothetical protein
MLRNSRNGFTSTKRAFLPFLWAMLLVTGFHLTHISDFQAGQKEGTFYENCNTKVSIPGITLENKHSSDLATFESEEKEEKSESESSLDFVLGNSHQVFVAGFFLSSGAATQSIKIPSIEGKSPLYILFHSLRVHLA